MLCDIVSMDAPPLLNRHNNFLATTHYTIHHHGRKVAPARQNGRCAHRAPVRDLLGGWTTAVLHLRRSR